MPNKVQIIQLSHSIYIFLLETCSHFPKCQMREDRHVLIALILLNNLSVTVPRMTQVSSAITKVVIF